jgi:hypothetical protein
VSIIRVVKYDSAHQLQETGCVSIIRVVKYDSAHQLQETGCVSIIREVKYDSAHQLQESCLKSPCLCPVPIGLYEMSTGLSGSYQHDVVQPKLTLFVYCICLVT